MSEEKSVVKIYDPESTPFGDLSNNSVRLMNLDGKIWTTVTNYVYSNLLITPIYRTIVQLSPPFPKMRQIAQQPWSEYRYGKHYRPEKLRKIDPEKESQKIIANVEALEGRRLSFKEMESIRQSVQEDIELQKMNIYDLLGYYFNLEKFAVTRTALEKAYNVLVSNDENLVQILLETNKRPIIYTSQNTTLGVNDRGEGHNLVGKTLMQIRHNVQLQEMVKRKEMERKEKDEAVFKIYKAFVFLNEQLQKGDDLSEYVGQTAEQIADLSEIDIETRKDSVLQMYERGQFPEFKKELDNPGYLASHIRKVNLEKIKKRKIDEKNDTILNIYMDHIISQKFPKMDEDERKEAINQLIYTIPDDNKVEKYRDLLNRVLLLYNTGSLPEEVSSKIEVALQDFKEPSAGSKESAQSVQEDNRSTTSTSSEEGNVLKQMLSSDEKGKRSFLISQIQKYTGKASHKYKKWATEHLEEVLGRYEGKTGVAKKPKEGAGYWKVEIKHKRNTKELLYQGENTEKPDSDFIAKLIKKYNKNAKNQITAGQVFLTWVPKIKHSVEDEDEEEKVVVPDYVKEHGDPIRFGAKEDSELTPFSPLTYTELKIDNYSYPNVSSYVITMMMTQTGYSQVKGIFVRGSSVEHAREMLSKPETKENGDKIADRYYSPEQCIQIYDEEIEKTFGILSETFARISMRRKFEATDLQDLLLSTKDSTLIWADPNDVFLGIGNRKRIGRNIAGKILMEIRDEIREKRQATPLKEIGNNINLVLSDPFVVKWMNSKMKDMCNAVYKVKRYLSETGNVEEEIDARFIKYVLNLIYQPVYQSVTSGFVVDLRSIQKSTIPLPEIFIAEVRDCQGLPVILTETYSKELEKLKNQRDERNDLFFGIGATAKKTPKKLSLVKLAQKQVKDFRRFMAQEPPPSQEQIEVLKKAQKNELLNETKDSPSLAEKQRKEWIELNLKLLKPRKEWSEIYQTMGALRETLKDEPPKIKAKKWADRWVEIIEPELSVEERNRLIEEFLRKQEEEYLSYYGKEKKGYTPLQLAEHDAMMKDFKTRIMEINRKIKDQLSHTEFAIREIGEVYWSRIMVIFQAILANNPGMDVDSFRQYLIDEDEVRNKKIMCTGDVDLLKNEDENCIAKALINILSGITGFKYQYAEDIPFGATDIDLAGSILLNSPIDPPKKKEIVKEAENDEEEIEVLDIKLEDVRPEFEDNMALEEDEIPEQYDYDAEVASMGFATFGMSEKLERLNQTLRQLSGDDVENLSNLSKYFLEMVKFVKEQDQPGRVNFFLKMPF